jgi:hypothetical protein
MHVFSGMGVALLEVDFLFFGTLTVGLPAFPENLYSLLFLCWAIWSVGSKSAAVAVTSWVFIGGSECQRSVGFGDL